MLSLVNDFNYVICFRTNVVWIVCFVFSDEFTEGIWQQVSAALWISFKILVPCLKLMGQF